MARRILITSTSYPRSSEDWQSLFIREMLGAVARRSDSCVSYWGPSGPLPANVRFLASDSDASFLKRLGDSGGIAHRLRSQPLAGLTTGFELVRRMRRTLRQHRSTVDVFHLNWLQSVLALPRIGSPALVTVLGSDYKLFQRRGLKTLILRHIAANCVALAPNAAWMVPGLERAFGRHVRMIRCVPFGIDRRFYEVQRRPEDSVRRWLTVLRLTRSKLGPLLEWTKKHASEHDEFHLFGPMQEKVSLPEWINYHGPITPDALIGDWYPRATAVITLSEHSEGRPQALLEAMAAGLPVIASRLDGHDDLIAATAGGLVVDDEVEFDSAVRTFSDDGVRAQFAAAARSAVERMFGTWDDCAERYASICDELLKDGRS